MTQTSPSDLDLAPRLIALLTAQRDVYQQLAELARQQSQYVAAAASEKLMSVLGARARLIDELALLDAKLQPIKPHWQQTLATLPAEQRATVNDLLRQVEDLLAQILAQDEVDKQALIQQKDDIGAQLRTTVSGRQLNRAYGMRPRAPTPGLGLG